MNDSEHTILTLCVPIGKVSLISLWFHVQNGIDIENVFSPERIYHFQQNKTNKQTNKQTNK